jgi:methionyl-tRNA formyltransferase
MINVVFLGNWGLGATALDVVAKHPSFKVMAVITRYDPEKNDSWYNMVWEAAQKLGLYKWNYKGKKKEDVSKVIRDSNPDLLLSASYSKILPKSDIELPKLGAINIHPSLLPKYRGGDPLSEIIINGDKIAGQTIHFMDEGVDTGDIIDQVTFPLSENPNKVEVLEKHNIAVVPLLTRVLDYFVNGEVPRKAQIL